MKYFIKHFEVAFKFMFLIKYDRLFIFRLYFFNNIMLKRLLTKFYLAVVLIKN